MPTDRQRKDHIKQAFDRKKAILDRRPQAGRGTAVTRAEWQGGLHGLLREGDWTLEVDMSKASGGEGRGPNPGMLGRGALASCLMISIAYWAAEWDITLEALEVDIEADYEARTLYETGPAYEGLRYLIRIQSPASKDTIVRLIDKAEQHTTYFKVFSEAQPLQRQLAYTPSHQETQ